MERYVISKQLRIQKELLVPLWIEVVAKEATAKALLPERNDHERVHVESVCNA